MIVGEIGGIIIDEIGGDLKYVCHPKHIRVFKAFLWRW